MPELPEVETIKNALQQRIGCCKIIDAVVRNTKLRKNIPNDLCIKITNASIIRYRRIAKYLVIDLSNKVSLIWHMGMSGKIKTTQNIPETLDKHDHVIITTTNGVIIYNDPRRFGLLNYCSTNELNAHECFKKTGLDPFDKKLNAEFLFQKLQKHPQTPIKISLLNQEIISGIGNIYASEILYESRISPLRKSADLSLEECNNIIIQTRKVLNKAISAGGSTLRDYKKPDGSLGYFQNQHCVYNKTGQRCSCCVCDITKTKGIKRIIVGGRSTFFCEELQK